MGYQTLFGFSDSPFLDVPDQKFLFLSKPHERLLSELVEFVEARQGLAIVSGEEGVGKTMLVQALIQRLPSSFHPLVIARPSPEPLAVPLLIARALSLCLDQRGLVSLSPLAEAVQAAAQQQQYYVLIVEDAHTLTDQNLEEIYLLSQMEYQGRQLMPILLVGRKGLLPKISSKANQRLKELIRKNLFLAGLTFEETPRYIDHRLKQVGSNFKACFAEDCAGQIFARTGGIPRRINQICEQALTRAWQQNRSRVSRDLLGEEEPVPSFKPLAPPSRWGTLKSYGALAGLLLAASLVSYGLLQNFSSKPVLQPPQPVPEAPGRQVSPQPTLPQAQPLPPPAAAPSQQLENKDTGPDEEEPPPSLTADSEGRRQAQELAVADTSRVPPAAEEAAKSQGPLPSTYEVAPEDGLIRIVAAHYPDAKELGYDAIILANPQIDNEDFIYSGQRLALPLVDKNTNVITLNNHEHFMVYGHYSSRAQVQKVVARLTELQVRHLVRETALPGAGPVYRIFLGGYETLADLQKAMTLAEQK